ncbi:MAG: hypothetical protein JXR96_20360 [Deltaproteobacteria bacterium]|nr:hypothetical protein [Deltaproteobacteria bacterium]
MPDEGLHEAVMRFKRRIILQELRACGWKKKEAAQRLKLSPRSMSYYISRLDLERCRDQQTAGCDEDPAREEEERWR